MLAHIIAGYKGGSSKGVPKEILREKLNLTGTGKRAPKKEWTVGSALASMKINYWGQDRTTVAMNAVLERTEYVFHCLYDCLFKRSFCESVLLEILGRWRLMRFVSFSEVAHKPFLGQVDDTVLSWTLGPSKTGQEPMQSTRCLASSMSSWKTLPGILQTFFAEQ